MRRPVKEYAGIAGVSRRAGCGFGESRLSKGLLRASAGSWGGVAPRNDATRHEESVANRTSIGILSVSVWWSSRSSRTLPKQNQSHEQLPTNIRIGLSCITNFLMGRLDPSARFGRIKIWHGTPIALQNDWHFRNFAGTAALCL